MDRPPQTWEGGSNTFKVGSLKRRLPAVVLATLDSQQASDLGIVAQQIVLKGLSGTLKIQIMAAFSSVDGLTPISPDLVPAGAATIQLTPAVLTPNAGKIFGRPVFQDPTASPNVNTPLPQDLPFGWEFTTEADEVYIDVEIDNTLLDGSKLTGQIVVAATVEYNGSWWSIEAIRYAISQVQLTGCEAPLFGTAGG
jgi:hypothetical protein